MNIIIIIIIIIHEFQSDASPEELQGRCSVTVVSLWLWPVTRTAERPDKQLSLQYSRKALINYLDGVNETLKPLPMVIFSSPQSGSKK